MTKYLIPYTFYLFMLSVGVSHVNSCSQSSSRPSAANQNVSHVYKADKTPLHPKYTVFHRSGTTSELHFKINSQELLYSKQGGSENFSARLSIHYVLISSYDTKDIIDSATAYLTDPYSSTAKDIIGKIDFNPTSTNAYVLQVDLTDLNRNTTVQTSFEIDKINSATRQNFIVLSPKNKTPLFRNTIGKNEHFYIRYRTPYTKLFVRYYHRDFPLPSPPFATSNMTPFEYKADSLFTIEPEEKDTTGYLFKKTGFYHIQSDTSTKDGLTLYRFDDDFPSVKKPEHLLLPLRYLTSKQEYETMGSYKNLKLAVDSFWVAAGGSHDRARELVKKYYNRVKDANEYFSSYIEGWLTDRGLIYVIYGPPTMVYRYTDSENWVYGEANNFNSLTLTFVKVINPFTDNDYRLSRSELYKTSWYNSVEMWRQGRVYADK